MRIALLCPAADDVARAALQSWLHELRELAEVELFVEPRREGTHAELGALKPLSALTPRTFDQIVHPLADTLAHGFMLPAIRALGGVVVLPRWELGNAARAAYPSLESGGLRGFRRALAEGGLAEARAWARLRKGAAAGEPAFNRSAVRFGDAFVIHDEQLNRRILVDRNERTPIALVPDPAEPRAFAHALVEAFEQFPHPRSARRSLVALAFRARAAVREERAAAEPADASVKART